MSLERVFLCVFYSLMIVHMLVYFGCMWLEEKGKGWISPSKESNQHLVIGVPELDVNEHCSQQTEVHLEFCLSDTTWLRQHAGVPLSTGNRPTAPLSTQFGGFFAFPPLLLPTLASLPTHQCHWVLQPFSNRPLHWLISVAPFCRPWWWGTWHISS